LDNLSLRGTHTHTHTHTQTHTHTHTHKLVLQDTVFYIYDPLDPEGPHRLARPLALPSRPPRHTHTHTRTHTHTYTHTHTHTNQPFVFPAIISKLNNYPNAVLERVMEYLITDILDFINMTFHTESRRINDF